MKVKRMGITEILRRIWLLSANEIKSSESVSKQRTQLIIAAAEIRHIKFSFVEKSQKFHLLFSVSVEENFLTGLSRMNLF